MADNFPQEHLIVHSPLTAHEDIFNGSPASDVVHLKYYERATFIVLTSTNAGSGAATITIESCSNAAGANNTAVAFKYRACTTIDTFGAWTDATTGGTSVAAGTNQVWEATVTRDELSGTHEFVRMQLTESQSDAVDGAILIVLTGMKYMDSVPPTGIV